MRLCVGAVSRRIVEEAAKLQVHQVVASRAQVDVDGGYTGLDQRALVRTVHDLSDGKTKVVRDHGGPLQSGKNDNGVNSFDTDVVEGFDTLHIDVCRLTSRDAQAETLQSLVRRYRDDTFIEIGDEHGDQTWNEHLLEIALQENAKVSYCVVNFGTYAWADRQCGLPQPVMAAMVYANRIRTRDVLAKMHNADDFGPRMEYRDVMDAYNIAPEIGKVEVRALLATLPFETAHFLLNYAFESFRWRRWFNHDEGTWQERAECALRYLLNDPVVTDAIGELDERRESFVRRMISNAIKRG